MTTSGDGYNPTAPGDQPDDLAAVAPGVTAEQVARWERVIDRFLRGHYFSLDEEGKVAAWNDQAEARFGWAALEIVGEDFFEHAAPEARDELMPVVAGEVEEGSSGRALELETRRRDGAALTTEVAFVPIRVGDGYPLNTLLQDITTHRGNPVEMTRMKRRHAPVLALIVAALDGADMPVPLDEDADEGKPATGRMAHLR